jgi:hypothetical protein
MARFVHIRSLARPDSQWTPQPAADAFVDKDLKHFS